MEKQVGYLIGNSKLKMSLLCSFLLLLLITASYHSLKDHRQESLASSNIPLPLSTNSLRDETIARLMKLPLSFEKNEGQTDTPVQYLSRGHGYHFYFTPQEILMVFSKQVPDEQDRSPAILKMRFMGANQDPFIAGVEEQEKKSNYFIGNDSTQWRTHIPNYAKIRYQELYSGIDSIFYGNQEQIEYDICVAPGANPSDARFQFEGTQNLAIDLEGNLCLSIGDDRQIRMNKPIVYQTIEGKTVFVEGEFTLLAQNEVGFAIGNYDKGHMLVIDPIINFSTYLGGSNNDDGFGIAADSSGNVYITGQTRSADFPVFNPFQPTLLDTADAFVTKMNSTGFLLYSTYLGGNNATSGQAIAVDSGNNAYVTGFTNATDFPTLNPFQGVAPPFTNAFVTKFDPTGSALVYSTYLGGNSTDLGFGIAVDSSGFAYVTGQTSSNNFPTANAIQSGYAGGGDGFVTKLTVSGDLLVYSTYLGGSGIDLPGGIAVDSAGNAYVAGSTSSANFPTFNALQPALVGAGDAFVTKIDPTGLNFVYSTYLGGTGGSSDGAGIVADSSGNAYVTGSTSSANFPTVNALQPSLLGTSNAFITKFDPIGSALIYSTYLGGSGNTGGNSISIDSLGNAYVAGVTQSPNFPTTANAVQTGLLGVSDAFLSKINPAGTTLLYSTYFGGGGIDGVDTLALTTTGAYTYLTGTTNSTDFPIVNAFQPTFGGGSSDAFVASFAIGTPVITSINPTQGPTAGGTVVSITGLNLNDITEVHFGPNLATIICSCSLDTLVVISPPGTGTVDVTVTTGAGETSAITPADQFTYISEIVVIDIFPPTFLTGTQCKNKFATQTDIFNVITWEPPAEGKPPVEYRLYRNAELTKLIAVIPSNQQLRFKDHNRKKDKTYRYWIVSVDEFGNVSEPAVVTVKVKCK